MASENHAKAVLHEAWDEMIAEFERARRAVDDPRLWPPPLTDRNLAEGYRYLLGFLHGAIEQALANPDFPSFRRAIQPLNKSTIDNADAIYLTATIDGNSTYRVRGRAQDHRHWRGEARAPHGRRAPQYVIFEAQATKAGQRINTGTLDSAELAIGADGRFEVLLAPEPPEGYAGNFIATKAQAPWKNPADGTVKEAAYTAQALVVRELFYDWESEDNLDLYVERVGREGGHPEPLDPDAAARQMRAAGAFAREQMHYWNKFYAVTLETYGDQNGDGERFMPRNAFNQPLAAGVAPGGGQSTNVYSGGVYELDPDEALVVEMRIPVEPAYIGFHLSNLWGESLDFANHVSSVNGFQGERDEDGGLHFVVSHRDPGVPNWLDTTGLPEGFLTARWSYSRLPDTLPTIRATKVSLDEIRKHLPAETRTVSPQERIRQVQIRRAHVERRYRMY